MWPDIRAGPWHTFSKGPRLRKIKPPRIERIERIDTYGKISDDFVRFLWMMANAASTNFRLSQPSPNSEPSLSQDTFTKLRGSLFSRFRVQIAAAIAKAAAARFVPDSTNDGIPTFVVWDRGRKPLTNSAPEDDLPLYHIPCT